MKHQYTPLQSARIVMPILLIVGMALVAVAAPPAPWRQDLTPPIIDHVDNPYLRGESRPVTRDGAQLIGPWVRTTGGVRVLAIPVSFTKDELPITTGTGVIPYETWGPASSEDYIKDRLQLLEYYFFEVSNYNLFMSFKLSKEAKLSKSMKDYGGAEDMEKKSNALMKDVVASVDKDIDFRNYDIIMLIHAGCGREVSGLDGDIWSHYMPTDTPIATDDEGMKISSWVVVPETHCTDQTFLKANTNIDDLQKYEKTPEAYEDIVIFDPHPFDVLGVWAHELGHALGMPDVYNTNGSYGVSLGQWSVMASGSYLPEPPTNYHLIPYNEEQPLYGSIPCHPDAWNKQLMNWATVKNITGKNPNEVIRPVGISNEVYRLWTDGNISSKEYFLLENRVQSGWDSALPESGLLIYHIDDSVGTLARNDLQWSSTHPRIYPVSADDILEFVGGNFEPSVNTAWPGSMPNTTLSSTSTPNSRAYSGDKSFVEIKNIHLDTNNNIIADLRVNPTFRISRPRYGDEIFVNEPYLDVQTPFAVAPESLSISVNGVGLTAAPTYYDSEAKLLRVPLDRTTIGPLSTGDYTVTIKGRETDETGLSEEEHYFRVREKVIRGGLRMISIPVALRPMYGETPTVFGPGVGMRNLAWYDPAVGNYIYLPDEAPLAYDPIYQSAPSFAPSLARVNGDDAILSPAGLGLWSNLSGETPLQLSGDVLLNESSYELALSKGFNMIGSPYTYSVTMQSLMVKYQGKTYTLDQAVSKKLVAPVLYSWFYDEADSSRSSYQTRPMSSAVLDPFAGYWIYIYAGSTDASDRVSVLFQPTPTVRAATASPAAAVARPSDTNWQLSLIARAADQGAGTVVVGVNGNASNLVDVTSDRFAPPPAPRGISLVSIAGDNSLPLMEDFRAPGAGVSRTWNLQLSGKAGVPITITWPDLTQVPRSSSVLLRDTVTGETRYLRTLSAHTVMLSPEESSRQLTLTVTPGGVGAMQIISLQPRPGRTTGEFAITCQLSQDAQVSAVIRTMSGKLIRKMTMTPSANRQATLLWDGCDEAGRPVPASTSYQCEVQAVSETGQSSRAVTRIVIR